MKNKKKWIIVLVLIVLLLLFIILYLLFGREKSFRITFDTNGGTNISSIEVKIMKLLNFQKLLQKRDINLLLGQMKKGKL